MYNDDQRYSYNSDGDTTHGSMNFRNESFQQINKLEDGTVEIMDTLPKKEYYMSLRKGESGRMGGSMSRIGMGSTTGFGTLNTGTIRPGFFGQRSQSILDFKPSGKNIDVLVVMLDGSEETFTIDKQSYGQHLFDMICTHLELNEAEFFGITYKDQTKVWYWLDLSKKINKQVKDDRLIFEFQVKFYPPNLEIIIEDLTRYYFCLQIRQDLVSGILPCSFYVYVLLGSYIIQSEAGDYDPVSHKGIEYIKEQPLAPQEFQTDELLYRIVELHKQHRGQTPEEADKHFLDNVKKLALYGVDSHKVKDSEGNDIKIGVYHGGLLIYRNRIRVIRFSWARLIKVSYKRKKIHLIIREVTKSDTRKEMSFKSKDVKLAKRLYQTIVDHHYFFRMIEFGVPKKPNLKPGFATRKYYKNPTPNSASPTHNNHQPYFNTNDRNNSVPAPKIRRLPQTRKEQSEDGWFTLPSKDHSFNNAVSSSPKVPDITDKNHLYNNSQHNQQQLRNSAQASGDIGSNHTLTHTGTSPVPLAPGERPKLPHLHWRMSPADCTLSLGMDERGLDVASQQGAGWQGARANKGVKATGEYFYEARVLEDGLVRLGWSTNDADLVLGQDDSGYGYGADEQGKGWSPGHKSGRIVHDNKSEEYGCAISVGDFIGCRINMDSGELCFYKNGKSMGKVPEHVISDQMRREPFYPAMSVKDGRVEFNFGDSAAFVYPPSDSDNWVPLCQCDETNQVPNKHVGWKLNVYDSSNKGLDVSPEGLMAQSQLGEGWKGTRCNKGVRGRGKYYYEVSPVEENGLARVGWSTEQGNLNLGSDQYGFGYGADQDGFGLTGHQGKKMWSNDIENYGKAFSRDDVVGCLLDLDIGTVQWSMNGEIYPVAYHIPLELRNGPSAFYPTASMKDNTLDFNFGEKAFKYYPGNEWTPLTYTPEQFLKESRRRGPERKVKGWSYINNDEDIDIKRLSTRVVPGEIHPQQPIIELPIIHDDPNKIEVHINGDDAASNYPESNLINKTGTRTVTNGEVTEVQTINPDVETEEYVDEHGNLVRRTITKKKKITKTTKTMSELVTERSENDVTTSSFGKLSINSTQCDPDDEELCRAIFAVTNLDCNANVLNDHLCSVEFVTNQSSGGGGTPSTPAAVASNNQRLSTHRESQL